MVAKTVVKKAKYGKGLFAAEDIEYSRLLKDRPIIISFEFKKTTPKKWEKMVEKLKIPEDSGMYGINAVKYDPTFVNPKKPPKWYRLNHSFTPNAEMKSKSKIVYWSPLRKISKGEEITFDYGQPDPSWSKTD